ncbi:hypothetical protein F2Q69_00033348 [Brassica cretica]|uniref:Hyaluronan/mRNA-binding protein domain-containing protein n=1 Tax=Brassica cretica TaxID=69181 RepID=A0A8S9SDL6_BRACR|nr:hypothetical protein F2Q69_00033348 [Brassica cretica]
MTTLNPFDLLDDDIEDPTLLAAAKPLKVEKAAPAQPAKLPTKPTPPSQAVREARGGRNGGGARGGGRGRGGGFNRESRNFDAPANENGYVGGGYRRSEGGDAGRRGGYRGRGGRHGDSGDLERPRRNFERHSGTAHGHELKRDGAGRGNWGTIEDDIPPVTEGSTPVVETDLAVEKEGEATDANKETPVEAQAEKEPEPEDKEMTLEEYEKGTDKDKRPVEKEEKTKKSLSINEFLKPANGERYRGGYRGGRGRGPRGADEGGRGPRGGAEGGRGPKGGADRKAAAPAPKIEDAAHFPTLGK